MVAKNYSAWVTGNPMRNCFCCAMSLFERLKGFYICDALRGLAQFAQFKKREKHPWMSVTFSKVAGFNRQLNYTNGTKSRKASHTIHF